MCYPSRRWFPPATRTMFTSALALSTVMSTPCDASSRTYRREGRRVSGVDLGSIHTLASTHQDERVEPELISVRVFI